MKYIAISGSLRKESLNLKLLQAVEELLPANVETYQIATLNEIPMLNPDDLTAGFPAAVNNLAKAVKEADAVIISSPEYNYSISGAMKNALDFLSIHPDQPLRGKSVALMSASIGLFGGARGQYHLRQALIYPGARVVGVPEIMLGTADKKFDENGKLTDEVAKDLIKQQLEELQNICR